MNCLCLCTALRRRHRHARPPGLGGRAGGAGAAQGGQPTLDPGERHAGEAGVLMASVWAAGWLVSVVGADKTPSGRLSGPVRVRWWGAWWRGTLVSRGLARRCPSPVSWGACLRSLSPRDLGPSSSWTFTQVGGQGACGVGAQGPRMACAGGGMAPPGGGGTCTAAAQQLPCCSLQIT